jgi:hypothetical protein
MIESVRELLLRVQRDKTVLESLSDDEFQRLVRELPGIHLNRREVITVDPDPDLFVKLARAHGDAADRRFFAAFHATHPHGGGAIYLEFRSDWGACRLYGSGHLVETYRRWTQFRRAFPKRYAAAVNAELKRVADEFVEPQCACGDIASVKRELRGFLGAFPSSPLRGQIGRQLQELQAGRSHVRTDCTPG